MSADMLTYFSGGKHLSKSELVIIIHYYGCHPEQLKNIRQTHGGYTYQCAAATKTRQYLSFEGEK